MNELELFIQALNRIKGYGLHVPHLSITPSKWGAIKNVSLKLWFVDGDNKELLSEVTETIRITTDEEKNDAVDRLVSATMENILRNGVQ